MAVALVLVLLAAGRTYLGGNIEPGTDAADVHRRAAAFVQAFTSGRPMPAVPKGHAILAAIMGAAVIVGGVRAYEMSDPVREARLEVARPTDDYRVHITYLQALMDSGVRPVDCHAVMDPTLARAPSTAFVYVGMAWCLWNRKQQDEARVYARKALAREVVRDNLHGCSTCWSARTVNRCSSTRFIPRTCGA